MRHQKHTDGRAFRPQMHDDDLIDGPGPHGPRGPHGKRERGKGLGRGFGPGGPGFGGPGFGGPGFGFGGPGGGRRGWRGPRPRGDVRAAILLLLAEQPRHGYELIGEIAERSGGVWTPSPGSVYPTLQALQDEGLIRLTKVEGRRTASLTDQGTAWVAEHRDTMGDPFAVDGPPAGELALRQELGALMGAVEQVGRVGTEAQQTATVAALTQARKEIYRLLADDAPSGV